MRRQRAYQPQAGCGQGSLKTGNPVFRLPLHRESKHPDGFSGRNLCKHPNLSERRHPRASGNLGKIPTTFCLFEHCRMSGKISACAGMTAYVVFRLPLHLAKLSGAVRGFPTDRHSGTACLLSERCCPCADENDGLCRFQAAFGVLHRFRALNRLRAV